VKLESPLLAPFAKIEWAKTEIDNLNERINAFFEANPYTLGSEVDQNGIEVWRYAPPKIPTETLIVLAPGPAAISCETWTIISRSPIIRSNPGSNSAEHTQR
jgi:hypothetical protein